MNHNQFLKNDLINEIFQIYLKAIIILILNVISLHRKFIYL